MDEGPNILEAEQGAAGFRTTHWSVVLIAAGAEGPKAEDALDRFCRSYWRPIYGYTRRLGNSPSDAEDLTQEFFARLLEKDYLRGVDPQKGRFRTFLLLVLKRFLANEWDRAHRHKRQGSRKILSLDDTEAEERFQIGLAEAETPERVFERRWALAVLERVVRQLEGEMRLEGKLGLFHELKDFLGGENSRGSYAEAARRLQMAEGTLRVTVHRLRRRYRELLRAEVAATVSSPEEVDDEIRYLFASLA